MAAVHTVNNPRKNHDSTRVPWRRDLLEVPGPDSDAGRVSGQVDETARRSTPEYARLIRPHRTCAITAKSVQPSRRAWDLGPMRDRISSYVPEPYILYRLSNVKDRVTPTTEGRQDELTPRPGQQAPEMGCNGRRNERGGDGRGRSLENEVRSPATGLASISSDAHAFSRCRSLTYSGTTSAARER